MTHSHSFAQQRVLITGGLGFIGSHLARRLVEAGASVTLLDNLTPEYGGNRFNVQAIETRLKLIVGDMRDEHCLQQLVPGQDYIFNLAGQTSHLDSMTDPFTDLDINCRAQLVLLETCRHYNPTAKIIFASTRQIYGRPDSLPVNEAHPLCPVDVNGIHKIAGETYHHLYNQVYGLRTCALRLTNTYGPHMRIKDARQTFLGTWIRALIEGRSIEVWGGEQLRDFTFVDDVVEALWRAALTEAINGQALNLGGDAPVSLLALARLLIDVYGGGEFVQSQFPPERQRIDIGDYYADFTRARELLGWVPQTPLREGLARTVEFYRLWGKQYL